MPADYTIPLWLLKLGALLNLYFLANTFGPGFDAAEPSLLVPAQILFAVSAYRCLFPNRYKDNVVLHDTPLSSTLVTRVLATFAEVAWIYQFSHVLRLLNLEKAAGVEALSWLMVLAVTISQVFVWSAILSGRLSFYFHEEIGWAVIFGANTIASGYLTLSLDSLDGRESLLQLNLLFGVVYLPWQALHLRSLWVDARARARTEAHGGAATAEPLASRLGRSFRDRKRATDAESWGGLAGLTWMTAYWATLIPMWVNHVVQLGAAP